MNAVEFHNVSKSYAIYESPGDRLRELLSPTRAKHHQDFWALRDVTFEVKRGETFCIVGENGSGKSTLLQIVAGILQPTSCGFFPRMFMVCEPQSHSYRENQQNFYNI